MQILKSFFEHAASHGSRSTILKDLIWLIGVTFSALLTCSWLNIGSHVLYVITGVLVVEILLFIFAYVYCLFKNPDWLRSEKFSIQKMAIEKGVIGDSLTGFVDGGSEKAPPIGNASSKTLEYKNEE